MKRYWAIVEGTFVVPLAEMAPEEMKRIREDVRFRNICAIPTYFSRGDGVWPTPNNSCIVVQEIKLEEI